MNRPWLALYGLFLALAVPMTVLNIARGQLPAERCWRCIRLEICPPWDERRDGDASVPLRCAEEYTRQEGAAHSQPAGIPQHVEEYTRQEGAALWMGQPMDHSATTAGSPNDEGGLVGWYLTGYDADYDMAVYGNTSPAMIAQRPLDQPVSDLLTQDGGGRPAGVSLVGRSIPAIPACPVAYVPFDGEPETIEDYVILYGGQFDDIQASHGARIRVYDSRWLLGDRTEEETAESHGVGGIIAAVPERANAAGDAIVPRDDVAASRTPEVTPTLADHATNGQTTMPSMVEHRHGAALLYVPFNLVSRIESSGWEEIRCRCWAWLYSLHRDGPELWAELRDVLVRITVSTDRTNVIDGESGGSRGSFFVATSFGRNEPRSAAVPVVNATNEPSISGGENSEPVEWYPWPDYDDEGTNPTSGVRSHGNWHRSFIFPVRQLSTMWYSLQGRLRDGYRQMASLLVANDYAQLVLGVAAHSLMDTGRMLQNAAAKLQSWCNPATPAVSRRRIDSVGF